MVEREKVKVRKRQKNYWISSILTSDWLRIWDMAMLLWLIESFFSSWMLILSLSPSLSSSSIFLYISISSPYFPASNTTQTLDFFRSGKLPLRAGSQTLNWSASGGSPTSWPRPAIRPPRRMMRLLPPPQRPKPMPNSNGKREKRTR